MHTCSISQRKNEQIKDTVEHIAYKTNNIRTLVSVVKNEPRHEKTCHMQTTKAQIRLRIRTV